MSRGERERLIELRRTLARTTTLLLIEHDMDVALRVADRVVVMADGVVIAAAPRRRSAATRLVNEVYLGRRAPWLT